MHIRENEHSVAGAMAVERVGVQSFDAALQLLQRFFREEDFETPLEAMRSSLQAMLDSPDSAVFLARHGPQPLGVATVTTSVGIEFGRSAELEDLYVLPEARRSGVASALIEAVCSWCGQRGCTTVLVTVTPEGEARHQLTGFYRRRGFLNTRRVILERTLPPASDEPG